ncbi:uncharacterized protein LOC130635457 isoform X2 [Hydractinia symbiolongicarpus]|uniref:uncharacterized protein LOC130635457 isoform X2 n=1 Tax=Hydractinia symbiolongicarpus TaxID=13093 RepID=UPI0025518572|nr:uncharacterized protein LOC130635457 isoform X2 [Hydractinia symbiolongicarpus]
MMLQLVLTLCAFGLVSTGDVTATTSDVIAFFNTTLQLQWKIRFNAGQYLVGLDIYVLPDERNAILSAVSPVLQPAGRALFGDRISSTFKSSDYVLTLRNVKYNETLSFKLQAIFYNPLETRDAIISIKMVLGAPQNEMPFNYRKIQNSYNNSTNRNTETDKKREI